MQTAHKIRYITRYYYVLNRFLFCNKTYCPYISSSARKMKYQTILIKHTIGI